MTRAVAYFGTYDPDYPRNAVLIAGLRERGVEVHEFHAALPPLTAAEMAGRPRGRAPRRGRGRGTRAAAGAAPRQPDVDAVIVGLPRPLPGAVRRGCSPPSATRTWSSIRWSRCWTRSPATAAWCAAAAAKAAAVRAVDEVAFRLPALVLADTRAHAAYYQADVRAARASGWPSCRSGALPEPRADGAAPRTAPPASRSPCSSTASGARCTAPTTVLAAADLLRDEPVRFVLIGEGQLSGELRDEHRRAAG